MARRKPPSAEPLFAAAEAELRGSVQPLAARMRPRTLEEFTGQRHFLGEGKLLSRLIAADRLGSLLFYGPPGTGKTTLAHLLAKSTRSRFVELSAVGSGVKELRAELDAASDYVSREGLKTLLFIDEIHRFNKAQQDVMLPEVEEGIVILVGATTQNPFFAVNGALVSRSRVLEFHPLSVDDVLSLLQRALKDKTRGLGNYDVQAEEGALRYLAEVCDGDARRALGALEIAVLSNSTFPLKLTKELAAESVQRKAAVHDRDGDAHYDCISAFIKSIRGSDVDAALYWLARMLEGGEEVRFITRRLVILASEDIGNADPHALPMAVAAMQACEFLGLPECQLTLAQTTAYLACAPKSNASTLAIGEALADVREGRLLEVPQHLKDSHYAGAKQLGRGVGYEYSHDAADGVSAQQYLSERKEYYRPVERGFEMQLAKRLVVLRERLRAESNAPAAPSEE